MGVEGSARAIAAIIAAGVEHTVTRHGPAGSLAESAGAATGFDRGTITPFGSTRAWPVIADETVAGRTISPGGGAHGVALNADGSDVIRALAAQVADVTDPRASGP